MDQTEKQKFLARLRSYDSPRGFSSRSAAKTTVEGLRRGEKLMAEDIRQLESLRDLLATAALGLAAEGEMTFGMIKPRVNEGIGLPPDDDTAAQALIALIGEENVLLRFHALLDESQVGRLYGAEAMERLWKTESEHGKPVAQVLLEFIPSDAVTMTLVHHGEENAVNWLKKVVGATRPSQAHPDSIRGSHGRDDLMPNNLVHRSGSKEEAIAEIAAFQSIIQDLIKLGGHELSD